MNLPMRQKLIIGLTGPIASGKNEAAKIFKKCGAYIIDADRIGHIVLEEEKKDIVKNFGNEIISKSGKTDRKILGGMVFKDLAKLRILNKITHPKILRTVKAKILSLNNRVIVINAAVLKEIGLVNLVNLVIAIIAKKSLRLKRLAEKSLNIQDAKSRLSSQMPDHEFKKMADFVIYNNGDKKQFKEKMIKIYEKIT